MATTSVLRLITRLNVGGPARHVLLLSRGLQPEYDTLLAAGSAPPSEGELSDGEVAVHRLPIVRNVHALHDARALHAVRRLLVARQPRVLHTHMAKAGSIGRLAVLTMPPDRRPLTVHTFHGHVLRGYFGPLNERAVSAAERWLAHHTDLLIAVSPEVRDDLLALGVGRPDRFEVVPPGLDLSGFLGVNAPSGVLRRQIGVEPDAPLIGVVGRLVPVKDHITLLTAMRELPAAHLAVIGDGEQRRNLEVRAHEMGLGRRVHFAGWRYDMPAILSDLDVVALASKNEGTPVALIEASAAARPVVATAVGGVPSVVADGTTGLLAPPGDPHALADRLRALLAEPARRNAMGRAGRERVRSSFGDERLLADMRRVYSDLLSRR